MAVFNEPTQWDHTLGNNADTSTLPDDAVATAGIASLQKLFQIINATPLEAGGIAPAREDVNALFKLLGDSIFYAMTGGIASYNATYDYPVGALVKYEGKAYLCISPNGVGSTVVQPGADDTYWQRITTEADTPAPIPDATTKVKGIVQLCDDIKQNADNITMAVTPHAVAAYVSAGGKKANDIGIVGRQGFGVSFPDATEDELAAIGLTPMNGTYDKTSDNYGNFMSDLGGVFVFIPHFFVRYGSEKSSVYDTYGANSIDIKRHKEYATEAEANADGYFTPRGFYDGSSKWKQGVFIQKYEPFAKAVGGVNYPYGDGSAYGWVNITPPDMMTYAKNLGSDYHVATAFAHEVAEIILIAQAQHSNGIANCAWWQSKGGANYPIQWNKSTPEKYSHNGQKNGIMMISNCRWEFVLGITTAGTSATQGQTAVTNNYLYVLKPEVKAKDITNGFGDVNDAWGTSSSLLNIYNKVDVTDHFTLTTSRTWYWGNGNTRMFMQPIGEDGILVPYKRDLFMLVPDSNNSVSASKNTAMGPCKSFNDPTTQNLALYIHGENIYSAEEQNVFSRTFYRWRVHSGDVYSFRCGVYLRD